MKRILAAITLLLLAVFPARLHACAVCFGKSDDAMAHGMNMGIFTLLLVVGFVLSGIGAFAIYLARRAARFPSEPEPLPLTDATVEPAAGLTSNSSESAAARPLLEPISQTSK